MENLLGDSATIERICREKPSLAKRIWERIKTLIDSLGQTSSEREEIKKLRETERLFRAALETGGQDYIRGEMEDLSKKGAQHSLKSDFADEIDNWFAETTPEERAKSGKRFILGSTTDVLKSIGVKECDIYFGGSKINTILERNESMTLDIIKQAVKLLDDPILIMESVTVDNSIVIFGEVYTTDGKPVMISVLYDPKNKNGEILDYAVITSAYGRRIGNLQNLINKSKIYYINEQKNRTDKWLKALGLQLPSAITKYGSINIISQNPKKSTPGVKKSKKIIDDEYLSAVESGDMETAQRLVDEAAKEVTSINEEKMQVSNGQIGVDIYTEEQYNRFGWAREAGAITFNELDNVYSKVMEKGSLKSFPQSFDGEAIIVANDKAKSTLDADDIFVFAIGRKYNFTITKVIRPIYNFYPARARKVIYDIFKKHSNDRAMVIARDMLFEDGLFDYFFRENSPSYQEYRDSAGESNEGITDGRSGSEENPSDARIWQDGSGDINGAGNRVIKYSRKASTDGEAAKSTLNLPLLNRSQF